ncbi:hypothetical protein CKAN_01224200 [Cinnamomum micranthum f. kanehirae]|uniref:Uncharacterized protein n=1 Tax=Cinnamomum micranthum f. kanehirae TaxID=337451 RepID=A0A3S3QD54_9MAGN|nr:hypothetical protein CKAN_01224200 [Cinnamomum micranthum f. kanehirae]
MAKHPKFFSAFLVLLILLIQVFAEAALENVDGGGETGALYKKYHNSKINCPHACAKRCRSASRKNVCTRACGTCCMRCHCVPPGTYGNRNACPCYASLRTHGGKPKCP